MKEKIVGIDLGTTNSVIAVIQDRAPKILQVQGMTLLPSVVGISSDNKLEVVSLYRVYPGRRYNAIYSSSDIEWL